MATKAFPSWPWQGAALGFHSVPFSHRNMDMMSDDYWRSFGSPIARPLGGYSLSPQIDVEEDDASVTVTAEFPGVEESDLDVRFSHGILTIRGEKKTETEEQERHYVFHERSFGVLERSLVIGPEINEEHMKAKFRNGILTITLPKAEHAKGEPRRIEIETT